MPTFHEHLKRKIRAKMTAPLASEATQQEIDRRRNNAIDPRGSNKAVSDALTGTDRRSQTKHLTNLTAAYNDDTTPQTCPATGASLDPKSHYTRPMVKRVDAETFDDLKRIANLLKSAGRHHGYAAHSPLGGVMLVACANPGAARDKANFIVGKSPSGGYVARALMPGGKTALVARAKG